MIRDSTSQGRLGLPTRANRNTASTKTSSRKPVPQRGMPRGELLRELRVGPAAGLVGVDDLVLGAVILEHPAQVGDAG